MSAPQPTWACVVVPALPLQVLGQQIPEVHHKPAAVVDEDRPQGRVEWVNRLARQAGILPGMRYAAALSLASTLRAGVVPADVVQRAVDLLATQLRTFSPYVEPSVTEPGVFWLDASGLLGLYDSLQTWADATHSHLLELGWHNVVTVGWRRFATYAIGRASRSIHVCTSPETEDALLQRVPLAALGPAWGLPHKVRDDLQRLGVTRVGEFLCLPASQLRERYGPEALHCQHLMLDRLALPLRPELPQAPPQASADVEPPDNNSERLLFVLRGLVVQLVRQVALRRESVVQLTLVLDLGLPVGDVRRDRTGESLGKPAVPRVLREHLQPAEPTLQDTVLTDLLRLRLELLTLPAAVEKVHLYLQTAPATADQLRLWQLAARRDPDAGRRAIARLRAAFGPERIVRAVPTHEHLPRASYTWQPVDALPESPPPSAPAQPDLPMVRRLWSQPQPWNGGPLPDGGRLLASSSPVRWRHGWWGQAVCLDWYYVYSSNGGTFWISRDCETAQLLLQGQVD